MRLANRPAARRGAPARSPVTPRRGPSGAPLVLGTAAAVLAAATLLCTGAAEAQPVWTDAGPPPVVWLEVLKPEVADVDVPFTSTAWHLGGAFALGETTALVAEVPVGIVGDREISGFEGRTITVEGQADLGNPYVGVEIAAQPDLTYELGARLPLAEGSRGLGVGLAADGVDRLEAWNPGDFLPVVGAVDFVSTRPSGLLTRLRGGASVWIPADEGDLELTLQYGGHAGWEGEDLRLLAGLTGRAVLTGSGDVGERTLHQIGGAATLRLDAVQPGVQLRVPLDDELADVVFGVGLAVPLR